MSAASAAVLFYADTVAGAGAVWHTGEGIVTDSANRWGLTIDAGGVWAGLFDGAHKNVQIACGTGAWHLAQTTHDGVNLRLRIDGGSWSTVAAGARVGDNALIVGQSAGAACFDGRILEVITASAVLTDADFDNFRSYCLGRYGVSV